MVPLMTTDENKRPGGVTDPLRVSHLLTEDLEAGCKATNQGIMHLTPVIADVTCPECKALPAERI